MLEVVDLGERERVEGKPSFVHEYSLEAEAGLDIRRELFKRMAERGWAILSLRSSELTLEEIFLELVDDDAKHGGGKA